MRAIEGAWKVGAYAAAKGGTGVDGNQEEVGFDRGGIFWRQRKGRVGEGRDGDEVRAFGLRAGGDEAGMCYVGSVGPCAEVGGGVYADDEVGGEADDHDPAGSRGMKENFRVTELGTVSGEDGVTGVFGEGVAIVVGVGEVLGLSGQGAKGVDCYNAVGGVREEAGGVVGVDDGGTAEDTFGGGGGGDGDWLIGPAEHVSRGCVAPMLVTGHICGRVVLMEVVNGCDLIGASPFGYLH